ncbi:MAG: class I SAM-dependent methyltransferase [Burkholderiaceae bacterium]
MHHYRQLPTPGHGKRKLSYVGVQSVAAEFHIDNRCQRTGTMLMRCPVCEGITCRFFMIVEARTYLRCDDCLATFLQPSQLPLAGVELERYRQHRNDPGDNGYRQFLDQLTTPLLQRLPPAQRGLDYGCGPGPVLAAMLREAGHAVALFDPFFVPDQEVLAHGYDFITCTEVIEHFHRPADEFRKFDALLKPGGWLALMTTFQKDDAGFAQWYYRRDFTHVVFYRETTLRHLARHYGWSCEFPCANVALLQKNVRKPQSARSA